MPVEAWLPTRRLMAANDRCVATRMAWGAQRGGRGRTQRGVPVSARQSRAGPGPPQSLSRLRTLQGSRALKEARGPSQRDAARGGALPGPTLYMMPE
jgi:hypothetical protein